WLSLHDPSGFGELACGHMACWNDSTLRERRGKGDVDWSESMTAPRTVQDDRICPWIKARIVVPDHGPTIVRSQPFGPYPSCHPSSRSRDSGGAAVSSPGTGLWGCGKPPPSPSMGLSLAAGRSERPSREIRTACNGFIHNPPGESRAGPGGRAITVGSPDPG